MSFWFAPYKIQILPSFALKNALAAFSPHDIIIVLPVPVRGAQQATSEFRRRKTALNRRLNAQRPGRQALYVRPAPGKIDW